MDRLTRRASLFTVVSLCSSCTTAALAPDQPAAVMLGEWSYAAPNRTSEPPTLNTGLHVAVLIDSLAGARFWGRVTVWFAGDVGTPPAAFGRVAGRIDDQARVTLEIPRTTPGHASVMVVGAVAGDVLTVMACHSGAGSGPFAVGATFERIVAQ